MTTRLSGCRAIVTGASRGIGKAIAERFDSEGAKVTLAARSKNELEEIANSLDGESLVVKCDVRETEDVNAMVQQTVDTFGGLDIVVNNAGVFDRNKLHSANDQDIDWVIDVNLKGQMRVARASIPALIDSGGTLINVSSQLGQVGVAGAPAYCATKGGIDNLTRQLAVEYSSKGVNINCLAPGVVRTSMTTGAEENNSKWAEQKRKMIPMDRIGSTEDITGPAVFLASDESNYITGHVLVVDGGYISK